MILTHETSQGLFSRDRPVIVNASMLGRAIAMEGRPFLGGRFRLTNGRF